MNHSNLNATIKVALADDHNLLRSALANLIDGFEGCKVISHASTGRELIDQVKQGIIPDVVLLDLNMPDLDGHETALWLHKNYPDVYVLMLTMFDADLALIRLLQAGVRGFLKKDAHPSELKDAIYSVAESGFYCSHSTTGKIANLFRNKSPKSVAELQKVMLSDQEIQFLRLVATELTYKEMAFKMGISPRAVDAIRDQLFQKLDIKSRVGLVMFAVTRGIVSF